MKKTRSSLVASVVLLSSAAGVMSLVVLGQATASQTAPSASPRQALLASLARNVIVPGYRNLAQQCSALAGAAADLAAKPEPEAVEKTRQAWQDALLAARRMECFQLGPIVDQEYASSFYYWRILPVRMEEVLKAREPIDEHHLEQLGVSAKGMFALEYLLYDKIESTPGVENEPATVLLTAPEGERRRTYVLALARDLENKAKEIAQEWAATGEGTASTKFVTAGQESVNHLVNQLAQAVETATETRLHFILQLPQPVSRQLDRIEGARSGTTLRSLLALLKGVRDFFEGVGEVGLDDVLKQLKSPVAARIQDQFQTVSNSFRSIGAPLERAVNSNRAVLEKAYEKSRALEIMFKTELASTLGVTITFSSNDGD